MIASKAHMPWRACRRTRTNRVSGFIPVSPLSLLPLLLVNSCEFGSANMYDLTCSPGCWSHDHALHVQLFHDENGHRAMERRDQTNVNSKRHNEMIDVPPINPIHRSYKPSLPSWGESIVPLIDQDLKPEKNMVYHHYHPRKKTLVPKRIPKVVWVKPAGRFSAMFPQEISECPTFLYLFGDKSISYTLW